MSIGHTRLEILTPDIEVIVPLHHLFAVGKLLLKLVLA